MNAMNHNWAEASARPNAARPTLFRGLPRKDIRHLLNIFEEDRLADGDPLPRGRAEPPFVGLVLDGALREDVRTPQGGTRLFALTFAGEALSPLGPCHKGGRLSAMGDTRLLTCDRAVFDVLASSIPRLYMNLLGVMQDQITDAYRWQTLLGRKTATERVASMLTWFHARQGTPAELTLPLSRAELGEMSGLTLETVSRQFRNLQKAGVIALPRPRQVRVLDTETLIHLSGDAPLEHAA
ncbi:Crp/Fnr family transcriptional regulator [Lutimaribacter marinistellae]|uniref:Crp/Fnr family transcriptional regulator n=1 Tax=Lutimaribacter marinistellae TaxID=1820329 RepID=A0ABV7TFY1_9RHOB